MYLIKFYFYFRNEPIMNIIITTLEPVVYKSISTAKNRHTVYTYYTYVANE